MRTLRANEPSRQANGAPVTPIPQEVQHLNKYGGMAGTTAEEEESWKDPARQLAGGKRFTRALTCLNRIYLQKVILSEAKDL